MNDTGESTAMNDPTPRVPRPAGLGSLFQRDRLMVMALAILFLGIGLVMSGGSLLHPQNISNIIQQNALLLVVVIAQFLVVVCGGFDLSVGAVVALCSVVFAGMLGQGFVIAVAVTLATGALVGCVNGLLVTVARLPAFVVTLGTMQIGYSAAKLISGGGTMNSAFGGGALPGGLTAFFDMRFLFLPAPILVALAVFVAAWLYLRSATGCFAFAVGGSDSAARFSGIPVGRVRVITYGFASMLASVAGILFVLRVGYGDPNAGLMLPLDSIAALAIGGVSLMGGQGVMVMGILGAVLLGLLDNIMNLAGVSVTLQPVMRGVAVLAVVFLYMRKRIGA